MRIELCFIRIEARSKSHQRRREQPSKQDRGDQGEPMPRDFPDQHGSIGAGLTRSSYFTEAPSAFVILAAHGSFGMMNLLHGVHAAVGFGQEAFHVESIFRTKRRAHAQGDQVAAADMASGTRWPPDSSAPLFPRPLPA